MLVIGIEPMGYTYTKIPASLLPIRQLRPDIFSGHPGTLYGGMKFESPTRRGAIDTDRAAPPFGSHDGRVVEVMGFALQHHHHPAYHHNLFLGGNSLRNASTSNFIFLLYSVVVPRAKHYSTIASENGL